MGEITTNTSVELRHFIGKSQLKAMSDPLFRPIIEDLKVKIAAMPKTYETDGQGDEAIIGLHYFKGASDWYIIEIDAGCPKDEDPGIQSQAFGFACLNGDYLNAELGYISIAELIRYDVELDLYWKPLKLGDIKADIEAMAAFESCTPVQEKEEIC